MHAQGETINESGTMTGGGGKPRGGRMCLGNAAPRAVNTKAAASELAKDEQTLAAAQEVPFAALEMCSLPIGCLDEKSASACW